MAEALTMTTLLEGFHNNEGWQGDIQHEQWLIGGQKEGQGDRHDEHGI